MKKTGTLQNFINEEISSLIKEGAIVDDNTFKFVEKVSSCHFYNTQNLSKKYYVDIVGFGITINWRIIVWLNDAGIENFNIWIDGVNGEYTVEFTDKESGETIKTLNKNIGDIEWKFEISTIELRTGESLYVTSLDFDFNTERCEVNF